MSADMKPKSPASSPGPVPAHGDSSSADALVRQLLGKMDPALLGLSPEELSELLAQASKGPPKAETPGSRPFHRWQDGVIEEQIPVGASVLDMGCGTGELLARLMSNKKVWGQGIELDADAVAECIGRGVPVLQADLDEGLKGFNDQSFDYVVLEETLQTLHRPKHVLHEMLRVGRRGIVSFPNFAQWRVRLDMAIRGRMPVTRWLPFRWYDTPNIHVLSLQDFLDWAQAENVTIARAYVLAEGHVRVLLPGDNLHAEEALFVVEKAPTQD
jgi:methionine biosynthesis protein MetW